jgi:hypothetical protein
MANLEVRNPVARAKVGTTALAPRLSDLKTKRIALWWNSKAGGDIALKRVGELIRERYQHTEVEFIRANPTGSKAELERGQTFDGVIFGTAD